MSPSDSSATEPLLSDRPQMDRFSSLKIVSRRIRTALGHATASVAGFALLFGIFWIIIILFKRMMAFLEYVAAGDPPTWWNANAFGVWESDPNRISPDFSLQFFMLNAALVFCLFGWWSIPVVLTGAWAGIVESMSTRIPLLVRIVISLPLTVALVTSIYAAITIFIWLPPAGIIAIFHFLSRPHGWSDARNFVIVVFIMCFLGSFVEQREREQASSAESKTESKKESVKETPESNETMNP